MSDKVTPRSIAYAAVQVCPLTGISFTLKCLLQLSRSTSFILLSRQPQLGLRNITALITGLSTSLLLIILKKLRMKQRIAVMSFSGGGLCESNYSSYTSLSDAVMLIKKFRQVFPTSSSCLSSNMTDVRKTLKAQYTALVANLPS